MPIVIGALGGAVHFFFIFLPLEFVAQEVGHRTHEIDVGCGVEAFLEFEFNLIVCGKIYEVVDIETEEEGGSVFYYFTFKYAGGIL